MDDPDYVPTLQALVLEHDLSLIVPLTDLDHGVLSRAKDELGALVLLPKPERVRVPIGEGLEMDGWILHPPGFDAKKKWPLLMVVHGGPHNGITNDFHYRWNG